MILRRVLAMAAMLAGLSIVGSSGASAVVFFATLLGNNEVFSPTSGNPDGGVRAGDPDSYGSASIVQTGGTTLCFTIVVTRITAPILFAHIHRGAPGANGPIVVTLTPAPSAGNPGTSSGCVDASDGVTAQLITDMRIVPSNFYVNVHNQAFPGGALRGQLF